MLILPTCRCHGQLRTQLFDEVLHMPVEGVNDRPPRLVVLMVDRHRRETAPNLTLLEHVDADLGAKVLAQEVGGSRSSDPRPYDCCHRKREQPSPLKSSDEVFVV